MSQNLEHLQDGCLSCRIKTRQYLEGLRRGSKLVEMACYAGTVFGFGAAGFWGYELYGNCTSTQVDIAPVFFDSIMTAMGVGIAVFASLNAYAFRKEGKQYSKKISSLEKEIETFKGK